MQPGGALKAVFLDFATVSNRDLDASRLLEALPQLTLFDASSEAQVSARVEDAQVVLLNKISLDRALLTSARQLKLIALAATGTNNIDLAAAQEFGIAVCNIRAYCTASVAQHVWGAILTLTHHLREYERLLLDGSWVAGAQFTMLSMPIRELCGKTLGIVGYGELGRGVARIGAAFGMRIVAAARTGADTVDASDARSALGAASVSVASAGAGADPILRLPLQHLLAESDIVSLHCPLNAATRGLIGERELHLMKSDALLINTARGALIDAAALKNALLERRIGGAAIDVFAQEPPVDGDPLLDTELANLLLTPHIAWSARESRQRCIDEMAANVRDFLAGGRRGRVF
jgi:glycerate dehydrogenase